MKQSDWPLPKNETVQAYAPGDALRDELKRELSLQASQKIDIPLIIGGREVRTGNLRPVRMPHSHREILAEFHLAGARELKAAADAALKAKGDWEAMAWSDRAEIFLKAAHLISGPYRARLNASTMLGQSKNAYQAEIDAACELADFLRFNAYFYQEILKRQPLSTDGVHNQTDYRPLEGFVLAITPFNFTAIAGNLPACPAMLGNTVVWKPSDTQMHSAYVTYQIFKEAGLPDGVINLVAADGPLTSQVLVTHPDLAGIHFTGSTPTFQHIFKTVSENISKYKTYPRLVGETGGKDFIFAHPSADRAALKTAIVRGSFEYQGQKCSAASRAYLPHSIFNEIKSGLIEDVRSIAMGDVRDFRNFMNAVIDEKSFDRLSEYLAWAKSNPDCQILVGGGADKTAGFYVEPTIILTTDPKARTMCEELFGPVMTIFAYDDRETETAARLCESTSPYALTGAVFAQDRKEVEVLSKLFRQAAGNFYINDKPTGAVVGQQPFGGGRASGTNDKAGSELNLLRWLSPRTIKETYQPPTDYRYPFMSQE